MLTSQSNHTKVTLINFKVEVLIFFMLCLSIYLSNTYQAFPLKGGNQNMTHTHTHAHIHINSSYLSPRHLVQKKSVLCPTQHVRSVIHIGPRIGVISTTGS